MSCTLGARSLARAGIAALPSLDVPGLISKVWLSDQVGTTVGSSYTFEDAASCAAYGESKLFR